MAQSALSQEEILVRAREATIAYRRENHILTIDAIRGGSWDKFPVVQVAVKALTDLVKPLSEIVPVDEDLIEARKLCAEACNDAVNKRSYITGYLDGSLAVKRTLSGIKRGRELERNKK